MSSTDPSQLFGHTGRFLRINLTHEKCREEPTPKEWVFKYLGGRGLCARVYYDEISKELKALDRENELIFFTGPLTGTSVPSSCKCNCATKSPLTNRYFCSNAGGFFGPELKFAGYDGLIITGRALKFKYIWITDGSVEFRDADHLTSLFTSDTQRIIKEEVGRRTAKVMCIGPAGEKLVRFASIQTDHRTFGRGGLGAVMGSKRLKAVAVKGTEHINVCYPEELTKHLRELWPSVKQRVRDYQEHGTIYLVDLTDSSGILPAKNFQETLYNFAADKLGVQAISEYLVKHIPCFNCPVACGKLCEARTMPYKGIRGDLDYELIWAFGPMCGVYELSPIIAAVNLCDEYGMDGISTGYVISFAMELYERDLLSKRETDGLDLRYGNDDAMVEMVEKIGKRQDLGEILAEGARRAATKIGRDAMKYVMDVKGLSLTGWDPRGFTGMGLSFSTSSRGACHNVGGWTARAELSSGKLNRFRPQGKGKAVKRAQDTRAYIDSLGICTIIRSPLGFVGEEPDAKILNLTTGLDFTGKLLEIGERIYTLERIILNREGVDRKDDDLPSRIKTEPVTMEGPVKGHVLRDVDLNQMLNDYYTERGWNFMGKPTLETLRQLSIP